MQVGASASRKQSGPSAQTNICDSLRNRQLDLKTVSVAGEVERIIEAVRSVSFQVAGKGHLVATIQAALFQSVVHHAASDSFALVVWADGYVFNNARLFASFCHVVQDDQLIRACDQSIAQSHEDAEVRIAIEDCKVCSRLLDIEAGVTVNLSILVELENGRDVVLSRFA